MGKKGRGKYGKRVAFSGIKWYTKVYSYILGQCDPLRSKQSVSNKNMTVKKLRGYI